MANRLVQEIQPEGLSAGIYYAKAGDYLDALAAYVGILNSEMNFSTEESAAFAQRYIERFAESENAGLAAYIAARLAALEQR